MNLISIWILVWVLLNGCLRVVAETSNQEAFEDKMFGDKMRRGASTLPSASNPSEQASATKTEDASKQKVEDDDDDTPPAESPEKIAQREQRVQARIARQRRTLAQTNACVRARSKTRSGPRHYPKAEVLPHKDIEPLVQFRHAIDETDLLHLLILTNCVRKIAPNHFEYRPFDLGKTGYGGGNNVTYIGGFLEALMPDLTEHILDVASDAVKRAGWFPHPRHLGFRCIEVLDYYTGGELLMHVDADSVYTMVMMLADPAGFTGGDFVIKYRAWSSMQNSTSIAALPRLHARPDRLGGVIFDSETDHAVSPIVSGSRTVLAIELWDYDHVDLDGMRPHARLGTTRRRRRLLSQRLLDAERGTREGDSAPSHRGGGGASWSGGWGWGAIERAMSAALGSAAHIGQSPLSGAASGVGEFARGAVVGLAGALVIVFVFFRDSRELPPGHPLAGSRAKAE